MANITPIKSKTGDITGYRIRVLKYTDEKGNKHFYSENWAIPQSYKSASAIQKALEKETGRFENACKRGEISESNKTLLETARYYIETRDLKPASVRFYNSLLPFLEPIGHTKLKNLTPIQLDNFYKMLATSDVKHDAKAIANKKSIDLLSSMKLKDAAALIGLSEATIREAKKGNRIAVNSAEKISVYFKRPVKELFEVSSSGIGLSVKMIRHIHTFIYAVLEFAVKKGMLTQNVAIRTEPPRQSRHEADFFELDEILKIRDALQDEPMKYRVMTCILIETGMRRGELFGLRWSSIDYENATIRIDRNVQYIEGSGIIEGTPKSGRNRTVAISRDLVLLLKEYQQEQKRFVKIKFMNIEGAVERKYAEKAFNPAGYLFIQESGEVSSPNSLGAWMLKFSKKVGLHVHPHKFRHSQASLLINSGLDVVTVSKRLGHAQVSTTENIYAHILEHADRKASDAISALLAGNL